MQLVYKSERIKDPEISGISHIRDTIINLEGTTYDDTRDYVIKMGTLLFDILEREMCPERDDLPVMIKGIVCIEDNGDDNITEDFVYCIYRKEVLRKNEPVLALTPVKTLNEWFANLPLIYKLDLYNKYSEVITKHLK